MLSTPDPTPNSGWDAGSPTAFDPGCSFASTSCLSAGVREFCRCATHSREVCSARAAAAASSAGDDSNLAKPENGWSGADGVTWEQGAVA